MKTKIMGAVAAVVLSFGVAVVLISGSSGDQPQEPEKQARFGAI